MGVQRYDLEPTAYTVVLAPKEGGRLVFVDALTSEAAVERLARGQLRHQWVGAREWDDLSPRERETRLETARAAIRALLNEEANP